MHICVPHACVVATQARRDISAYKLKLQAEASPLWVLGLNLVSLREQQVLFTAQLSRQPSIFKKQNKKRSLVGLRAY